MRNKLLAILIGMATLLGSAMPIFAEETSINISSANLRFYTEQTYTVYPENNTDLRIPLYCRISPNVGTNTQYYYSGYINSDNTTIGNYFNVSTSTSTAYSPVLQYFEPIAENNGVYAFITNTGTIRLLLNNYHPMTVNSSFVLLGYLHYSIPQATGNAITFTVNPFQHDVSNAAALVKGTVYETGFYQAVHDAILDALDSDGSLYDIISVLNDIKGTLNNYLPSFETWLHDIEGNQENIKQLLRDILTTDNSTNVILSRFYQEYYNVVHASKDASVIQDDVDEKARISESLVAGMAMDRPDIKADDVNINEMIDQEVNTKFGNAVGSIFSNNFIVTMMMISVSAMIIGFVLYGKK